MDKMTNVMHENGLGDFWGKIFTAHRNTKKNTNSTDQLIRNIKIEYPIYILLVGLLFAYILAIVEICR